MPEHFNTSDITFMKRALVLARKGQGRVEPNPMVGCVLVRRNRIVGEGYHRVFGGPHAEVEALRDAGSKARGAVAYVTLEPCSHHGKTPPCAEAIIHAGVAGVVAAHDDPFPEVSGRGFRLLRQAGIEVRSGLLADEAAELNAPFLTRVLLNRPYVIAKWAQSLDGKIATRSGDSKWITGPEARRFAHRVRARVDAVVVGIGTVLADDPMLDARDVPVRRIATRVVFDSGLRVPSSARLIQTAGEFPTFVVATVDAIRRSGRKVERLKAQGVEVIGCRALGGRVSVRDALRRLAKRGFSNLLVEGGGELIGSFRDAGVLDEAHVYTAPIIIGGRMAVSGCGGEGAKTMADALKTRVLARRTLGADVLTVVRCTSQPHA